MSGAHRKRPLRLVLLGLLAVLTFPTMTSLGSHYGDENIVGDADFSEMAATYGWPGDGTAENPYLIEGWNRPLAIMFTTLHFVLRNCHIELQDPGATGLILYEVQNGRVEGCTIQGGHVGIELLGDLYNTKVVENSIDSDYYGIVLGPAQGVLVARNTVRYDWAGIYLAQATGNRVEENDVGKGVDQNETYHGIMVDDSRGNILERNSIHENLYDGIRVRTSQDNVLRANIVDFNGIGILLEDSNGTEITRNEITHNLEGLVLTRVHGTRVYDNAFSNYDPLHGARNARAEPGADTEWSVAPSPGPNILGGPRIGGNFWNDYIGVDADSDGLGEIPYGRPISNEQAPGCLETPLVLPPLLDCSVYDPLPLIGGLVQI